MRKEVEEVIRKADRNRKQAIVNSNDFKNFLFNNGVYTREFAPCKYTGIAYIDSAKVTFNVTAKEKIGDKKTVLFNGTKQRVVIEDIEIHETDTWGYELEFVDSEGNLFHYKKIPMSLTDEEVTALYECYTSLYYEKKPIVLVLNTIGIVVCIVGFIAGLIIAESADNCIGMLIIWAVAFIQAILFFSIASIVDLLNVIRHQQIHK